MSRFGDGIRVERRYFDDRNVLHTTFTTDSGAIALTACFTAPPPPGVKPCRSSFSRECSSRTKAASLEPPPRISNEVE
jgi:hypothetical protein